MRSIVCRRVRTGLGSSSFKLRWISSTTDDKHKAQEEARKVLLLIRTFKQYGHLVAAVDPLKLQEKLPSLHATIHGPRAVNPPKPYFETFNLQGLACGAAPDELLAQGFSVEDLNREFYLDNDLSIGPNATLLEIVQECQRLFCGSIGTEYQHLHNRDACQWVRKTLESELDTAPTIKEKLLYYTLLSRAENFEKFLGRRFSGAKRFSIEGAESLIPGLRVIFSTASDSGVQVIHMGMSHRGRLNVLANVLERPLHSIMSQFQPYLPDKPDDYPNNSDDVRYHLGTSSMLSMNNNNKTTLEVHLASNPSHLEAVNSVVLGETRARQLQIGGAADGEQKVVPILLHGDASMFQGSVREAFGFGQLVDYTTGGTIHIIVNNQIGFTTLPKEADSSVYCSDVAKIVGAPVFHVNADDVEAVVRVMRIAVRYRQRYRRDVVVDLVCYRRHGHNEQDSPEITAPVMYNHINSHPTVTRLYREQLTREGVLSEKDVTDIQQNFDELMTRAMKSSQRNPSHWDNAGDVTSWQKEWLPFEKTNFVSGTEEPNVSGVSRAILESHGASLFRIPPSFCAHKKVEAIMNNRLRAVETGDRVDWATAEALSISSLLAEGIDVRLSGQDCERGTFNQRHAVLHGQATSNEKNIVYVPLKELSGNNDGKFDICNSPLSEEGALAFEYGYSLQSVNSLTMWEAQFGDFANGAQTIIDTFIMSGEQKWERPSNLVLLLPHGYEGQGPEHSSARVERFLQQVCEDESEFQSDIASAESACNVHVIMPSTPAQYFHALRRQVLRNVRKPLIIFTPKSLLHHRPCTSDLEDMGTGTSFRALMPPHPDDLLIMTSDKTAVSTLIFCSGKIYYSIKNNLHTKRLENVATARIEQLAPFPFLQVANVIQSYPNAAIRFVQEEPKNMGAWSYVKPRLETVLRHLGDTRSIAYVGRPPSASPATGQFEVHAQEMKTLIKQVVAT